MSTAPFLIRFCFFLERNSLLFCCLNKKHAQKFEPIDSESSESTVCFWGKRFLGKNWLTRGGRENSGEETPVVVFKLPAREAGF
jgi:hypothetical protein